MLVKAFYDFFKVVLIYHIWNIWTDEGKNTGYLKIIELFNIHHHHHQNDKLNLKT